MEKKITCIFEEDATVAPDGVTEVFYTKDSVDDFDEKYADLLKAKGHVRFKSDDKVNKRKVTDEAVRTEN